jgi:hypothetical protein
LCWPGKPVTALSTKKKQELSALAAAAGQQLLWELTISYLLLFCFVFFGGVCCLVFLLPQCSLLFSLLVYIKLDFCFFQIDVPVRSQSQAGSIHTAPGEYIETTEKWPRKNNNTQ